MFPPLKCFILSSNIYKGKPKLLNLALANLSGFILTSCLLKVHEDPPDPLDKCFSNFNACMSHLGDFDTMQTLIQ